MLSSVKKPKKELNEYNKEKKANYQPNKSGVAKIHEQDFGEEEPPETPEPDLDNYYADTFSDTFYPWESFEYLNQFQHIPHNIFTKYNSF